MSEFQQFMNLGGLQSLNSSWSLLFMAVLVWSLVWKGMALWRAARMESKNWFVALLVVNTVGILDILYLYVFSKKSPKHDEQSVPMAMPPQQ